VEREKWKVETLLNFPHLNFPPAWYKAASDARVQAEYGAAAERHETQHPLLMERLRGRRKDGLRLKADDAAATEWAAADGGGCGSCYGAAEDSVCCDTIVRRREKCLSQEGLVFR
jgi:hypothetical protein